MSRTEHAEEVVTTAIGGVALILAAGAGVAFLARRLGQPAVVGQTTAGICLGPSLWGLLPGDLPELLFPSEAQHYLDATAPLGLPLLVFVIGWELDYRSLQGQRRRIGVIGICGTAVPMPLGLGLAVVLFSSYQTVDSRSVGSPEFALVMGTVTAIAAFPVLARAITDQQLYRRQSGFLATAITTLDDILAWCLLATVVALVTASGTNGFVSVVGWGLVYVGVMLRVVRPLPSAVARRLASSATPYLALVTASGALGSAFVTSTIGRHAIFGAFFFGLIMPRGAPHSLSHQGAQPPIEQFSRLLLPVCFVVIGLSVDVTSLTATGAPHMLLITAVACVSTLGSVLLAARVTGMSWSESSVLGLLMNTRGLTNLLILNVGLGLGLLSTGLVTSMVVMALVTTALTAPLVSVAHRRVNEPGDREHDDLPPAGAPVPPKALIRQRPI